MVKRNLRQAAVILFLCSVTACGSTTSHSPGGSTTPQVAPSPSHPDVLCESLRQLGSDVHALLTLDLVAVGANGLDTAVQQVRTQLQVVAHNAGTLFGPQLQALRASLDDLSDTIAGLTDAASIRAALPELRSELTAVGAGWDSLKGQAADVCR